MKVACVAVHVVGLLALAGTSAAATVADPATVLDEREPTTDTAVPAPSPRPEDATAVAPAAPVTTETVPAPPPTPVASPPEPPTPTPTAPAPTAAEPPAPASSAAVASPPAQSLQEKVEHSYRSTVPQRWRDAVPARLEVISGSTSWAWSDGRIQVARSHANSGAAHLGVIIAHEFGHLIAFAHGSGDYDGAPPAGWPPATSHPAEHWADCVQQVFTGTIGPAHGLPPCAGEQLSWAQRFLSSGPPA